MSLPHSLFLVIFGASGDLTRRKLMPALIKIHNGKRFPEHFAIIGCARTAYTDETYRAYLKEELIKSGSFPVTDHNNRLEFTRLCVLLFYLCDVLQRKNMLRLHPSYS